MNLQYYYWYFKNAIPSRICDDIIRYGKQLQQQTAITGQNKNKKIKDLKKQRDSNIVWLNERWIYNEIHPFVRAANENAGWNFQWDWSEECQFTIYKKGQHYDWHCDSWDKPYDNPEGNHPYQGKIRKLSVTVSLSDEKDYSGGELEFDFKNNDKKNRISKCKEIKAKGSIIVFPSFVWHRVCPVTRGERNSLVIWNLGNPFV